MDNAISKGIVPAEQFFAKRRTKPQEGCLVKTLFYDCCRVLHETTAVCSVDFHSCYHSVAHPIASVALQAWGVPFMLVKIMLSVLQTMQFYLRTGFGDGTSSYGGTVADPLGGLGQGNGAATLPAFTAVCSLLVMAYVNMGHGVQVNTAVTSLLFTIAAIIYVDDIDLLHWVRSAGMTDEEFFD